MGPVRVHDPTLPAGWEMIETNDGGTRTVYYWDTKNNVTTYDRPAGAGPIPPSAAVPGKVRRARIGQSRGDS